MNDLRKAAEMALKALESVYGKGKRCETAIKELRQALAHEAMDRMVAENQRLGLYDDLQTAIERGTKAWTNVPNASKWVDELRGNDTPEETPEVTPEVPCKTDPRAPHGFDRNASHSADRYVCECESWEPVDNVDISEERVHKLDKSIHELDLEAPLTVNGVPLYPKKEWVGLTNEEIADVWKTEYFNLSYELPRAIEAKLKEKNND